MQNSIPFTIYTFLENLNRMQNLLSKLDFTVVDQNLKYLYTNLLHINKQINCFIANIFIKYKYYITSFNKLLHPEGCIIHGFFPSF